MEIVAAALLLIWSAAVCLLLLRYKKLICLLWREPVLKRPVLIIESDDWGAGPLSQREALNALTRVLAEYRDREGRHPVMTLGLILAAADHEAMAQQQTLQYQRRDLADPAYDELREAINAGAAEGVFSLQLHGMEHYWPDAVMKAAQNDDAVRGWLTGSATAATETLPSHLQSRWVDGSRLPSVPIRGDAARAAVSEEVSLYRRLFADGEAVVVPPTFVWNADVEAAWAAQGMDVVVTPGRRAEQRSADGGVAPATKRLFNGGRGEAGVSYIVRDDYFEPQLGHRSDQVIGAMRVKGAAGRPTLLETHRFNFIGDQAAVKQAFNELDTMLSQVLVQFPAVGFISTAELARIYRDNDRDWLAQGLMSRLRAFSGRCRLEIGLWRGLRLTGLALLMPSR